MKRSIALLLATLLALGVLAGCGGSSTTPSASSPTTINLYSDGDTNVQSLWNNTLIPAFEKAYPAIKVHLVFSVHGGNDETTFARISAAIAAKKDPGVDVVDAGIVPDLATAKLLQPVNATTVPLSAHVDPQLLSAVDNLAVPYRASSVVLAYNTQKVSTPPTTLSDLLAWIKAHPGKFTYNTPDSGGSGNAFATAVIQANLSGDASTFTSGYDVTQESQWEAGLHTLASLKPFIYNNGFYPNGNVAVLQLLGTGAIDVAPVWSDQALSALATHQLPDSVKLIQLDPPFSGGPAYLGIPQYAAHTQQAYTFLNWLLQPGAQTQIVNIMHGYPGVDWTYMPTSVQQEFASIAKRYGTGFDNKYSADMHKKWQSEVAGG